MPRPKVQLNRDFLEIFQLRMGSKETSAYFNVDIFDIIIKGMGMKSMAISDDMLNVNDIIKWCRAVVH